jgi:hypothetical protein
MFVRAVRFTDVDPERMRALLARVEESGGPPPGLDTSGVQFLVDENQGTAVVLQAYPTAEAMAEGEKVFSAMDSGETPGTRASVDMCEVKLDLKA